MNDPLEAEVVNAPDQPTVTIERSGTGPLRWAWNVWWDDGDDTGHGIGGWAWTRLGARLAARKEAR